MHVHQGCGGNGGRNHRGVASQGLSDRPVDRTKVERGTIACLSGAAAERQVERLYRDKGYRIGASRWRGKRGEIDLIVLTTDGVVFVEVKRARTHAIAAERLGRPQIRRILAAAEEYLAEGIAGPEVRFDVALVDGNGRIEVIENALAA